MDLESILGVGQVGQEVLPEDAKFLREVLRAEPMQRILAHVVRGRTQGLAGQDLITEEGIRKALELQGIQRGMTLFVEDLIQIVEDLKDGDET